VLLAFGARVNVQNVYKKTPLDLVEGPWRFFSRHDSNHAIGSYHPPSLNAPSEVAVSSVLRECIDSESVPDQVRREFIHLLKSVGAQRAQNMPGIQPAPVLLSPVVKEGLSQFTMHPDPYIVTPRKTFSEKIMASIPLCENAISVLCSSDLANTSNAVALAENTQKLKMLRKAGDRILCLDGGGMKGLMQAEILAQIQAATGRKITEMFDWIIGTSIGGVIALAMVHGKCSSVKERPTFSSMLSPFHSFDLSPSSLAVNFPCLTNSFEGNKSVHQLKHLGSKIQLEVFGKGLAADVNATEEIMKACLPEDIKMCDVTYPR